MARRELKVIEANDVRTSVPEATADEGRVERLVALGRALSDPIRVRMLGLMAAATTEGRGCCGLPDLGVPVNEGDENVGVCVCEFEDYFRTGQSKVSYHVRKLKEAGLIREERRGKWSFYSLNEGAARLLLAEAGEHLGNLAVLAGAVEEEGRGRGA